jgi:hypothetical protein
MRRIGYIAIAALVLSYAAPGAHAWNIYYSFSGPGSGTGESSGYGSWYSIEVDPYFLYDQSTEAHACGNWSGAAYAIADPGSCSCSWWTADAPVPDAYHPAYYKAGSPSQSVSVKTSVWYEGDGCVYANAGLTSVFDVAYDGTIGWNAQVWIAHLESDGYWQANIIDGETEDLLDGYDWEVEFPVYFYSDYIEGAWVGVHGDLYASWDLESVAYAWSYVSANYAEAESYMDDPRASIWW